MSFHQADRSTDTGREAVPEINLFGVIFVVVVNAILISCDRWRRLAGRGKRRHWNTGWVPRQLVAIAVGTNIVGLGATGAVPTVEVTGRLVDAACYKLTQSNVGLDHAMPGRLEQNCAVECVRAGMPAGLLLPNGTLYVLTGPPAHNNVDLLADLGRQVTVTGAIAEDISPTISATTLTLAAH